MNPLGTSYKYTDRRTVALLKTYQYWLYDMPRNPRRSWSLRGAQIAEKIEKAYGISLRDKASLAKEIDWQVDRQEAREIISQHQGRTGEESP